MNLHEYQAKRLFAEHGIPIPHGEVAFTPEEARKITQDLGGRAVIKSQVLTGGEARRAESRSPKALMRPRQTPGRFWG